jgi:hypothetical protein
MGTDRSGQARLLPLLAIWGEKKKKGTNIANQNF